MATNLYIAGLFFFIICTALVSASQAATVDLCGIDEISNENFTLWLNFSGEKAMKNNGECSRVILLKSSRVELVVEELNIANGAVLEIYEGTGPNKGQNIGPKDGSQLPSSYVSASNALFIVFKNGQGEKGPSTFRGKIAAKPYQHTCHCRGVTNGLLECSETDRERKCTVKCQPLHMDLSINKDVTCDLVKGEWDIDIHNMPLACQKVQSPLQIKATVHFNYANLVCQDIDREKVRSAFRGFVEKDNDIQSKGVCFIPGGSCNNETTLQVNCTDDNSAKMAVTIIDRIAEPSTLKEANLKLQELSTAYKNLKLDGVLDSEELVMKKDNTSYTPDKGSFTKSITPLCNEQYDYIKVPGNQTTFVCSTCPLHHTYNATTQVCQKCPTGSIAPEGATSCTVKNGTNTTSPIKSSCTNACMKGKHVDAKSWMCEWCPLDTYQNSSTKLNPECFPCPDQKKTIFPGAQSVEECQDPCSRGTFKNSSSGACQYCPIGSYMDVEKHAFTKCKMCNMGKTTTGAGSKDSNDCYKCMLGQFYDSQSKMCSPCPEGKYQDEVNKDTCKDCPAGKKTLSPGSNSSSACVTLCGLGQFLNASTGNCDDCPVHTYQDIQQHHSSECKPCSENKITHAAGQSNASQCFESCNKGRFLDKSQCKKCPKGQYQDQTGQSQCKQCPEGKSTISEEQSDESSCLTTCGKGQFFDTNTKTCNPCRYGSYQKDNNHFHVNCEMCPSKKTTVQEGGDDPNTCIAIAKEDKFETITMSLRFVSLSWIEDLKDKNSAKYQETKKFIEDAIKFEYRYDPSFEVVKVTSLRSGSVVAEFNLQFNEKADHEPVKALQDAVHSGKVGNLAVSPESLKVLRQSCSQPLGMENGQIKNDQITASTHFTKYEPYEGRLNAKGGLGWQAMYTRDIEYLQIDFKKEVNISAVATQGVQFKTDAKYVTEYKLNISDDGITWKEYKENEKPKVKE